mgnify:CR=1 FL=1
MNLVMTPYPLSSKRHTVFVNSGANLLLNIRFVFLKDGVNRYDIMPMDEELVKSQDPNRIIPIHSIPTHYDLNLEPGWVIFNVDSKIIY